MSNTTLTKQTTFSNEDVISQAIQFFTSEKWTPQTQTGRSVTFIGKMPFSAGKILLNMVLVLGGFALCITLIGALIGIPLIIKGAKYLFKFKHGMSGPSGLKLTVTVSPIANGTNVVITFPQKQARQIVSSFLDTLPGA